MNDPHIDIDEIDKPDQPGINPGSHGASSTFASEESGRGPGFGDFLSSMTGQFRRWQKSMTPSGLLGLGGEMEVLPEETIQHLRNSQREFLLAWRALIDSSLERLDRQEEREHLKAEARKSGHTVSQPGRSTKIIVEEVDD
ncbi:MAG TPA: hypothetical protein VH186_10430 [Chloroflexia bacterium]|nr:hypothetical protein [Chloroflexia bacterium]